MKVRVTYSDFGNDKFVRNLESEIPEFVNHVGDHAHEDYGKEELEEAEHPEEGFGECGGHGCVWL